MYRYRYTGQNETQLHGYGIVLPNQEIYTDFEVNHPFFVLVTDEKDIEKKVRGVTKTRKVNAKI